MNQFTLRNVPEELEREIRREARQRKTSINKTVKELLGEILGVGASRGKKRDLSDFAGSWSEEEAREFEKATELFNRIDEELWK